MELDVSLGWPIPLDFNDLGAPALDIDVKQRSNLFKWNGQFSPQLVESLLCKYAERSYSVIDPFMGSGTVIIEAVKLDISAVGVDVNPAAFNIASVYELVGCSPSSRLSTISEIEDEFLRLVPSSHSLFGIPYCDSIPIAKLLRDLCSSCVKSSKKRSRVLSVLTVWATMLGSELDSPKPKLPSSVFEKIKTRVLELPFSESSVAVFNSDCRKLPIPSSSMDLVLTSPPYINVFNYHQQYRKAIEEFGLSPLQAARSEIGANRKHRGNRFLTVIQYCLDMAYCLVELCRVCRDGSRAIFVVGSRGPTTAV